MKTRIFAKKLKLQVDAKNKLVTGVYGKEAMFDFDEIYNEFIVYAEKMRPSVEDTTVIVYDAIKANKKVLFEGAQGTLLDLDLGTYPFVTSSHPTSGGFAVGAGVGPNMIKDVVGIVKAGIPDADNVGYAIKTTYLFNLIKSSVSASVIPNNNIVAGKSLPEKVKILQKYVFYIKCK